MVQRFRLSRCTGEKVSVHDSSARSMFGGALFGARRLAVLSTSTDLCFASGLAPRMLCQSRFETRRGLYNG